MLAAFLASLDPVFKTTLVLWLICLVMKWFGATLLDLISMLLLMLVNSKAAVITYITQKVSLVLLLVSTGIYTVWSVFKLIGLLLS
ncbi:hypothetical protein [Pseudomonas phage D6]|nr:hypothetical protein [Pseudomonas phage D6]